jgi:DNA-binding NtrC family response regulator
LATILCVDDDIAVLLVQTEVLRTQGHTVIPIQDPLQAPEVCRSYPDPIDLLITDMVMPGSNGLTLAKQLRAMRPHMKVLYMSGYGGRALHERGMTENVQLLPKPCPLNELFKAVQDVLSRDKEPVTSSRPRGINDHTDTCLTNKMNQETEDVSSHPSHYG